MKVRVIAGKYGGRIIDGAGTERTHPMGERIRNAMFNKIGSEVEGKRVLDAFAGSGSIGLEAVSRGAESALLIERDRIAQKIIEANIQLLDADEQVKLVKTSVSARYHLDELSCVGASPQTQAQLHYPSYCSALHLSYRHAVTFSLVLNNQ